MTETVQQKKGMSKGCLIALIVVAVLVVMVIIAAVVFYIYREDISKYAGATAVSQIKQQVAVNPPAGLDTTAFNAVCDEFSARIETDTLDETGYTAFLTKIRTLALDKKVDSAEAVIFLDAVFEYYPDLEELYYPAEEPDTSAVVDTLGSQE